MENVPEYKVELDRYSGPLDLLLYLIRREEVDIYDIPIARITEHYLRYLEIMSDMNINVAGEFVVMAATLMEIKSRMMVPEPEAMPDDEEDDPRLELVRQLMEYKRFKEAALVLTERARERAGRFERAGERGDAEGRQPQTSPEGVSLWGLLDAFSRLMAQTGARGPHMVVLDEMPQKQLENELAERVRLAGRVRFFSVFGAESDRALLIGMFLALLELVRRQVIRAEQDEAFEEIWLTYVPPEERPPAIESESTPHENASLTGEPSSSEATPNALDEDEGSVEDMDRE